MEDRLKRLLDILAPANIDREMAKRGVNMSDNGRRIIAKRMGCQEGEVDKLLANLSAALKAEDDKGGKVPPMFEFADHERYSYESDILGNVTLRDNQSGAEKSLRGSEAFKLLQELDFTSDVQALIAPYFNLTESVLEEDGFQDELGGQTKGTYNFPFKRGFGTAAFAMDDGEFKLKIISLRDANGDEFEFDLATEKEAKEEAKNFIDHA